MINCNKSDLIKVFYAFADDNAELIFNYIDKQGNETKNRRFKPFKIEYQEDDDEVLVTGLCPIFTDDGVIDWQQRKFYLEWMSCIRVYQEIRYAEMLDSKTWNRL